jgi:mRNA interferase YafQ
LTQPRTLRTANKFEKEIELAKRRGKDMAKLRAIIDLLITHQPLPREACDHPLKGQWIGYRDLHIEPDWLLIYKADDTDLWLYRTGTHADIFGT